MFNRFKGKNARKRSDSKTDDGSANDVPNSLPDDLHGRGGDVPISPPSRPPPPAPPPKPPLLLDKDWRTLDWSKRDNIKDNLRKIRIGNPDVEYLRILVHGPVGAGKSSFINSIDSIFMERMTNTALVATATEHSFTKTFETHYINDQTHEYFLPFAICDVMGLEDSQGVRTDDLANIIRGRIRDGYTFNSSNPCSERDPYYNRHPRLGDEIHCLVSVVSANNVSLMDDAVINKMRKVRAKVDRIPQVVVLTKIDDVCCKVAEDIKLIYRSRKIKTKMEECSNRLGIPMNCIFPVKCYSDEIDLINDVDMLLLSALKHILHFANDYVAKMVPRPANMRYSRPQHAEFEGSSIEHEQTVNTRSSSEGQHTDIEDSSNDSEDSSSELKYPVNPRRSWHVQRMDSLMSGRNSSEA